MRENRYVMTELESSCYEIGDWMIDQKEEKWVFSLIMSSFMCSGIFDRISDACEVLHYEMIDESVFPYTNTPISKTKQDLV